MDAFIAWGHGIQTDGSPDCGCTYGDISEAELMGPITAALVAELRARGFVVGSDADTGNDRNMTYTVRDANNSGAEIYVSVHCDFYLAPSGTYPICHPDSPEGYRLAQCIDNAVRARIPITTRGILKRADYEVRATGMPAVIFETGSIRADLDILRDMAPFYGQAMAIGILDYFGIPTESNDLLPHPAPPVLDTTEILLSFGDTGIAVGQLQRDLRAMAYEDAAGRTLIIDDDFGPATEYAVRRLQSFQQLAVDGIYGPISDAALMREIKTVQNALIDQGFAIEADGAVGQQTDAAIREFQRTKGLTPDGIVGTKTLAALGLS